MLETASMSVMTPPGLAIDSMKIALVFGVMPRSNEPRSSGSAHTTFQPKFLNEVLNWVFPPAIELAESDELVAWLHQAMKHQHLRGVARGHGQSRRAAFKS